MPNLPKCLVAPVRDGYTITPGNQVVSTQLDGGMSRLRLDQLGMSGYITIQWIVERDDYDYLMAFYRTATQFGSLPFLIDLIFDDNGPCEYTCTFVAGDNQTAQSNQGIQVTAQQGLSYTVTATLEITPNQQDIDADNLILARNEPSDV